MGTIWAGHDEEVAALDARFGPARRVRAELPAVCRGAVDGRRRSSEVCMVVRRPSGLLLTATKAFYPGGVQRLLTGGVDPGEPVLDALLRETHEETGLDVEVRRFLAVVDYAVPPDPPRFRTYAFLVDEVGGTLGAVDPHEQIEGYREVAIGDLPAMADALEALRGPRDRWDDDWEGWGRFRAVVHRVVHDALGEGP